MKETPTSFTSSLHGVDTPLTRRSVMEELKDWGDNVWDNAYDPTTCKHLSTTNQIFRDEHGVCVDNFDHVRTLNSPGSLWLFFDSENRIVASVGLGANVILLKDGAFSAIQSLVVSPHLRTAGIGKAAVEAMKRSITTQETIVHAGSKRAVVGWVVLSLQHTVGFWNKCGFITFDPQLYAVNGKTITFDQDLVPLKF